MREKPNFFCMAEREHPRVGADPRVCPNNGEQNRTKPNNGEQNQTPTNNTESQRAPPSYASPTTRRHLGFATKMPDEHFYKSIMNKCVFAWLSSRQARLIFVFVCKVTNNYSISQISMHLFSSYFSTFFPFFSLFLPFSVITPPFTFFNH